MEIYRLTITFQVLSRDNTAEAICYFACANGTTSNLGLILHGMHGWTNVYSYIRQNTDDPLGVTRSISLSPDALDLLDNPRNFAFEGVSTDDLPAALATEPAKLGLPSGRISWERVQVADDNPLFTDMALWRTGNRVVTQLDTISDNLFMRLVLAPVVALYTKACNRKTNRMACTEPVSTTNRRAFKFIFPYHRRTLADNLQRGWGLPVKAPS